MLVTGAAGGVGSVAVAVLAQLGYNVTASTGRPEEHDYLTRARRAEIIERGTLAEPSARRSNRSAGPARSTPSAATRSPRAARRCLHRRGRRLRPRRRHRPARPPSLPFILRGVSLPASTASDPARAAPRGLGPARRGPRPRPRHADRGHRPREVPDAAQASSTARCAGGSSSIPAASRSPPAASAAPGPRGRRPDMSALGRASAMSLLDDRPEQRRVVDRRRRSGRGANPRRPTAPGRTTSKTRPVTPADSGAGEPRDDRRDPARATSSPSPRRLALAHAEVLGHAGERGRGDGVDRDAVAAPAPSRGDDRERGDAGLGRAVVRLARRCRRCPTASVVLMIRASTVVAGLGPLAPVGGGVARSARRCP